jgi:hypothetical protein
VATDAEACAKRHGDQYLQRPTVEVITDKDYFNDKRARDQRIAEVFSFSLSRAREQVLSSQAAELS